MNYDKIKRTGILFLLGIGAITSLSCNDNDNANYPERVPTRLSVMPLPERVDYKESVVSLPQNVTVSQNIPASTSQLLKSTLEEKLSLSVSDASNDRAFIRVKQESDLAKEAYRLTVTKEGACVYYSTETGLLWGIQTLRQALEQANFFTSGSAKYLPMVDIKDAPKYDWRGFHIDVVRHMFTVEYLKKVIDCLSFYKINKLHLHLTDDQGWRIEVKKYPLLTQEGSWRDFDEYDKRCVELSQQDYNYEIDPRFVRNGSQYGGHYTQEEMKGLVSYALERGIDIVPEIDMPGHFSAAIKVYPELSCTGEAGWGEEFSYPICPSRPENYQFVQSIIDEMVEIFPSEYFHIGADEVEKDNWEQCEVCQRLMQQEGYQKVDELQNRFVKIMTNYVKGKGKKVMGWDDAFLEKEPQDLIYTYWRDWLPDQPGKITQKGYPIIFMEWSRFYLSATPSDEGLSSLYNFEFEPQFPGIVKQNVLGFQACVWTEMIPNERKFGQHVFPSLQAFSELAWGSSRNWIDFTNRLKWHVKWLNANGFYFTKPGFL